MLYNLPHMIQTPVFNVSQPSDSDISSQRHGVAAIGRLSKHQRWSRTTCDGAYNLRGVVSLCSHDHLYIQFLSLNRLLY